MRTLGHLYFAALRAQRLRAEGMSWWEIARELALGLVVVRQTRFWLYGLSRTSGEPEIQGCDQQ
jgi:hypothetical protein